MHKDNPLSPKKGLSPNGSFILKDKNCTHWNQIFKALYINKEMGEKNEITQNIKSESQWIFIFEKASQPQSLCLLFSFALKFNWFTRWNNVICPWNYLLQPA